MHTACNKTHYIFHIEKTPHLTMVLVDKRIDQQISNSLAFMCHKANNEIQYLPFDCPGSCYYHHSACSSQRFEQ